jgi:hypothetical protein
VTDEPLDDLNDLALGLLLTGRSIRRRLKDGCPDGLPSGLVDTLLELVEAAADIAKRDEQAAMNFLRDNILDEDEQEESDG